MDKRRLQQIKAQGACLAADANQAIIDELVCAVELLQSLKGFPISAADARILRGVLFCAMRRNGQLYRLFTADGDVKAVWKLIRHQIALVRLYRQLPRWWIV